MKVYSLTVLSVTSGTPAQATVLGSANDLSSFSFYQRGSVGEFMTFFTKVSHRGCQRRLTCQTVAERTAPNQPSTVEENNYKAHVFRTAPRQAGGLGMAGELFATLRDVCADLASGHDHRHRVPVQAGILTSHQTP